MNLDDCFRKGLIKKKLKDENLIKSLIEMARIKEITVNSAKIDKINISAYVSMAYDSLREILEALCVLNGYKVISHFCLGELLKDMVKEFDYEEFDRVRWIRNSINYYGEKVELRQGKEIIRKIFKIKNKMLKRYLK